ncbi:putative ribosome biogenesis protein sqt1 protein [Phaeoacremonium minimum UCRPA7]|uniref:Putative ribosome biogenesis protein sqt1 protein n=1 Tax=Phaeoacremonium minimum (strain UCR-PA7) TaxID=1286976 RepID=R8BJX4_PHAM7|nr:putative ribosome biogenesis protein sqt1 protein [Phaeoacremonium minimum UCRPA7]EON99620.1 putative ribosome biogenesis protein sqt1 protein [Phaeoacremonium minimum UCRPA7]
MSANPHQHPDDVDSDPDMLDADDALEEVVADEGDVAMDSGDEGDEQQEEITLQNDSIAYFDAHKDSVFAIAQHPTVPSLIATGGSEGEADDAPGRGYVIDISGVRERPVLPASWSSGGGEGGGAQRSTEISPVFTIEGHTDSINALAFTLPRGEFLLSGGMDGRLRVYAVAASPSAPASAKFKFVAESQEVPEINWLSACPDPSHPNTIALGASDGSVWVYTIDSSDASNPLQIVQSYFLHTGSATAGAWTSDGALLATVSEDSSLYVYDVWGIAAAKGSIDSNGMTVVSLTGEDQRFEVEGGLYSVAIEPRGGFLAVGGAGGSIRIVGLPRLSEQAQAPQGQTKSKARAGKAGRSAGAGGADSSTQAGQILAAIQVQSDGIETLSFSPAPQTLLASGSVDGSIAIFDTSRSFGLRRHTQGAHDEFSVVKVEFVKQNGWALTSCGMDGVVKRWDLRGATASQHVSSSDASGLVKEWRGHRGDGEGGGVLGFVQGETGERVVTAGDDGVVLVFEA